MNLCIISTYSWSSYKFCYFFSDEQSRERSTITPTVGEEQPIEPISDIGVDHINNLMFGWQSKYLWNEQKRRLPSTSGLKLKCKKMLSQLVVSSMYERELVFTTSDILVLALLRFGGTFPIRYEGLQFDIGIIGTKTCPLDPLYLWPKCLYRSFLVWPENLITIWSSYLVLAMFTYMIAWFGNTLKQIVIQMTWVGTLISKLHCFLILSIKTISERHLIWSKYVVFRERLPFSEKEKNAILKIFNI